MNGRNTFLTTETNAPGLMQDFTKPYGRLGGLMRQTRPTGASLGPFPQDVPETLDFIQYIIVDRIEAAEFD